MDAPPAAQLISTPIAGERRHVSVLFADMVGYTATLETLREDQAFEFAQAVYAILAGCVRDHEGSVHAFGGDSVMAVFGIGTATEDAALKACRAALAIHQCIAGHGDALETRFGTRPRMRVGVSSGIAIVAPVDSESTVLTTIGNTVNLASRIESLAPPQGSLICDETRRLVEWQVDAEFFTETAIKGVAKPQSLWRLLSVHRDASRFETSRGRGLSTLVGRDANLAAMHAALAESRDGLRVIDLVAEPGLGKTRLVYEFLSAVEERSVAVLAGHCTSEGGKTAFLPFIEVIRSHFGIAASDTRPVVAEKIADGLAVLDLDRPLHRALLLNLLGLRGEDQALGGLDGVLIGLRTQELLREIILAIAARGSVVLVIEDIHWIDTASERVLRNLATAQGARGLLVLHTRRPEYFPRWSERAGVSTQALTPLDSDDLARVLAGRLGVDSLPDDLLAQVAERAGGNPLFTEEVLRFLVEQGAVRVEHGAAVFEGLVGDEVLPASLLGLLSARLDRLGAEDRALLQVAATVGRRFDCALLAHAHAHGGPVDEKLDRLAEQDILYRDGEGAYAFKHVLMRDCVYHGLLPQHRGQLHLAVARSIEARGAGRLDESAEMLAHHYSQTQEAGRAFTYMVMAGNKSLNIFSLEEARGYFEAALALRRVEPGCADQAEFAAMLADYALALNLSLAVKPMLALAEEVLPQLEAMVPTRDHVLFLHHYSSMLVCNSRFADALEIQRRASEIAESLGDDEALAYALTSELSVSTYFAPLPPDEFAAKSARVEALLAEVEGTYLSNFHLATVGFDDICRGRMESALATADRLIATGTELNDPRALGYGTAMRALAASLSNDYEQALVLAERALDVSRTLFDRAIAKAAQCGAVVPLRHPNAETLVLAHLSICDRNGWHMFEGGPALALGVSRTLDGDLTQGIAMLEQQIAQREAEGFLSSAHWGRSILCEVYLGVLSRQASLPPGKLLRNLPAIARIQLVGAGRIERMVGQILAHPQYDPEGHQTGRARMILGLLAKLRGRHSEAAEQLQEARRIIGASGDSPLLARIDAALAELA